MPAKSKFPLLTPPRLVVPGNMIPTINTGTFASIVQPAGGIQAKVSGAVPTFSAPNQPAIIGWAGAVNYAAPGTFDLTIARPCNATPLGPWTVWEPPNCPYRKGWPITKPRTLFVSAGNDAAIASLYPTISAKGVTVIEYQDFGYGTSFFDSGIAGGGGGAIGSFSPLSDFPYSAVIDANLAGLGNLYQDFTLDADSFMGGDVLHVAFCQLAPWTTFMGDNYDDPFEGNVPYPFSGSEAPIYFEEFAGTPIAFGRGGLIFAGTAQRQLAAIGAAIGSMASYHLTIVCGNANTPSPALPLTGRTVSADYPASWNAIFGMISEPWLSVRFEDFSDLTMPATVIAEEVAAFFT
jgi:hypothetical protein